MCTWVAFGGISIERAALLLAFAFAFALWRAGCINTGLSCTNGYTFEGDLKDPMDGCIIVLVDEQALAGSK